MSAVVSAILENEGRYAVIGLPCVLKALRKAEQVNSRLRDRITYHLGLVCGQQKSTLFADYICALGGGHPRRMSAVRFRVKDRARPASDYGMGFTCGKTEAPEFEGTVYWTEGMKEAWGKGYFKLQACDYCDDLFAELADAAYMDAWLPGYTNDPSGTSMVVVRRPELAELFRAAASSGQVYLEGMDPAQVVRSQQSALRVKRDRLAERLAFARDRGWAVPTKRIRPLAELSRLKRAELCFEHATMRSSKIAFRVQKAVGRGLWMFRVWMATRQFPLRVWRRLLRRATAVQTNSVLLGER
jgi:coenzyme F420-reducing hydrogenase beta subunit